MKRRKRVLPILLIGSLLLGGCGSENKEEVSSESTMSTMDLSEMFTKRDLEIGYEEEESTKITLLDQKSSCDSDAVQIEEDTITITEEGTYILSGTLTDGMVIVNAEETDHVQLVLDNAEITSSESAAIYVLSAEKVVITTASGSENQLENGGTYTAIDENNIDAVIFSKSDLTLNGSGKLCITAKAGHGVVSKDDLALTSGTYEITAESHGISGKDSVRIADGTIQISAGEDGIHGSNSDDESLGFVYIAGGVLEISAGDDGIHADSEVQIVDGKINISQSYEGIEGETIEISGGETTVNSADDGLNATTGTEESPEESVGEVVTDTTGTVEEPPEKPEKPEGSTGEEMGKPGNEFENGFGKEFGNEPGGGAMDVEEDAYIQISGGILQITASGDGLDSNGSIFISGGETYVSGPTDGGNGSLDYGIEAVISGGIFAAAGSSEMAQNFSESSTQGTMMVTVDAQESGSQIILQDSSQNEIFSWIPEKEYTSVLISCPEIEEGEIYSLIAGNVTQQITMESLIYENGQMGRKSMAGMVENQVGK